MTLTGIWQNEYGSRMSLAARGTAVSGTYESTTGATGRYLVAGVQGETDATEALGQPVAFTISWRSIAPGLADPGWHWTSALGGQISIVDGSEVLSVSHLLIATGEFEGLCPPGIYSDKLTFRRLARIPEHSDETDLPGLPSNDPLTGKWAGSDGASLEAKVVPDRAGRLGILSGALRLEEDALPIVGFTDIKAGEGGVDRQSVAIAAVDIARNQAIALGGWIDGNDGRLKLQSLISQATSLEASWLQTQIKSQWFERRPTI